MRTPLRLRDLSRDEERVIKKLAHSQTFSARLVQRAKIILLAHEGKTIPQIAILLSVHENTVRKWFKRFSEQGQAGLEDAARKGTPPRYSGEEKAQIVQAVLTPPALLGLPFHSWTFERLSLYVQEHLSIEMKQTRIFEVLREEGLRWRKQESWFGERLDPEFAQKRGPSKP